MSESSAAVGVNGTFLKCEFTLFYKSNLKETGVYFKNVSTDLVLPKKSLGIRRLHTGFEEVIANLVDICRAQYQNRINNSN